MSTSAISSSLPSHQPNTQQNNFQQNFQALVQAIQSGNLPAAQQAYGTLTQNAPAAGASASGGQVNPFQQAIASIGTALQSGNLSGAQTQLQSLQQTMKSHHGHHRHGGSQTQVDGGNASGPSSTGIATFSPATSTLVDVSA